GERGDLDGAAVEVSEDGRELGAVRAKDGRAKADNPTADAQAHLLAGRAIEDHEGDLLRAGKARAEGGAPHGESACEADLRGRVPRRGNEEVVRALDLAVWRGQAEAA